MKTAKELFEELGFYCRYKGGNDLYYTNENKTVYYTFDQTFKDVDILDDECGYCFTPKMVQAIYKQCEELGWLDENK